MTFCSVFLGVLSGIIAGVLINIAIDAYRNWRIQRKNIKNLKFEIDFNIKKIDLLLADIQNYRNQVNGDSLPSFFHYFVLTQVITTTLGYMFHDRSIYKCLDHEHIGTLQIFYKLFSPEMERNLNNQITWNKEHIGELGVKQKVVQQIDALELGFKNVKKDLNTIKDKLK